MDREELDGLIATSAPNLLYLSVFWYHNLFLFPHDTKDYVVASRDNLSQPIVVIGHGDLDLTTNLKHVSDIVSYVSFNRYVSDDG